MNLCRLELMKIWLSTYLWAILGIFASLLALGILFLFIYPDIFESGKLVYSFDIGTLISVFLLLSFVFRSRTDAHLCHSSCNRCSSHCHWS